MVALVAGQPQVINLKEALRCFIGFRTDVVTRRTKFELRVARGRAHILEGLKIALDQIDKIIATIRKSESAEKARTALMRDFELSRIQAQAILDMQLRRLSNLERQKILDEYEAVIKTISYLEDLLGSPRKVLDLIKTEVAQIEAQYGDERRTEISSQEALGFSEEDLIPHERVVVTLSNRGFVKRVPAVKYRTQHRGGKGIIGMITREEDAVRLLAIADTHDNLLFFTNRGRVFSLRCHEIPSDASRVAKGMAVVNLFPVVAEERVTALVVLSEFKAGDFLLMATCLGEIKKTSADKFSYVRSSGLIAMDLARGDELVGASLATDTNDVILITQNGQSIRFNVAALRASSRTSGGVRAIRLSKDDEVVSVDVALPDAYLLVISSGGCGKLTPIDQYPRQHRSGTGVRTLRTTAKTGCVAAAKVVSLKQQVMIISAEGIVTRTPVREKGPGKGISIIGRSTQGVRLMKMEAGDRVVAIASFDGGNLYLEPKPGKGSG
jgi:DNA gyrase subunit A